MQNTMGAGLAIIFSLFAVVIVVLCFVFWIWMLVDAIKNPNLNSTEKVVWVLVVVFLHVLGALIYFLAGRKK
jgi:uncharacterized RDD family membrane protein YckC